MIQNRKGACLPSLKSWEHENRVGRFSYYNSPKNPCLSRV